MSRLVTYGGKTQSIAAWSRETGVSARTISVRLKKGWTLEAALTMPPNRGPSRKPEEEP